MPPIDWTSEDTRAVIQNMVASLVLLIVADLVVRGLLSIVGGTRPVLELTVGEHPVTLRDVDWPFIRVRNVGLPWSPRTRAALGVTAYGTVDGKEARFNWSSSGLVPPEKADIYGDRSDDLPLVVRCKLNGQSDLYGNSLRPATAYLTDLAFLTQGGGSGGWAGWPLADGEHRVSLTVQGLDGSKTHANFIITVAPMPAPLALKSAP